MKVLVVISLLVALTAAATSDLDLLTAFDYNALYNNDEQRNIAFDCLLDKGPCGDLQKLKDAVIKVIKNKCAECNKEQMAKYTHAMEVFRTKYEPVYTELAKKINTKK